MTDVEWTDPLAKQLWDKSQELKKGNGERKKLNYETTALMAEIVAHDRNNGGVVTKNELEELVRKQEKNCMATRRKHWKWLYAAVAVVSTFLGGVIGLVLQFLHLKASGGS